VIFLGLAQHARLDHGWDVLIGKLVRAVEERRAEVADLRRRVGRNSGNSSMPPSADDLPGKVPPRRGARHGRWGADARGDGLCSPSQLVAGWSRPAERLTRLTWTPVFVTGGDGPAVARHAISADSPASLSYLVS
jgi:Family of unknown function (DUF6444)